MKCIYNGKILKDGQELVGKALLFNDKIVDIIDEVNIPAEGVELIDAKGNYVSPGFVDIHIHGYHKVDVMDGTKEAVKTMAKGICANGVTSFLATTMTMSREHITHALDAIKEAKRETEKEAINGAEILGAHMEGPYISEKFKGAQNPQYIVSPTEEDAEFVKSYGDLVKLITIAPEIEGALPFIKQLHEEKNITFSMGHTAASFEEAMEGIKCGVSHTTHLFNGMNPLHHREPGALGAALASDVSAEAICDTIHIHKGLFPFLVKVKGTDKFVLVTDCMCAGGCEEGEYSLGGQKVIVKDGSARLEAGSLAGSVLTLNGALRNVLENTNYPVAEAIKFATINPATVIHVEDTKGTLDIGKDADIIIFDGEVQIKQTINKGRIIYENN
ncbi:MAG: N-acetylglucosamine-6-phosphate deacetylase [Cellulosilyticaceae bacterium]